MKAWLAGFYLLECADADEALDWARRLPLLVGEAVDCRAGRRAAPMTLRTWIGLEPHLVEIGREES